MGKVNKIENSLNDLIALQKAMKILQKRRGKSFKPERDCAMLYRESHNILGEYIDLLCSQTNI